jgi:hypothetical protein
VFVVLAGQEVPAGEVAARLRDLAARAAEPSEPGAAEKLARLEQELESAPVIARPFRPPEPPAPDPAAPTPAEALGVEIAGEEQADLQRGADLRGRIMDDSYARSAHTHQPGRRRRTGQP